MGTATKGRPQASAPHYSVVRGGHGQWIVTDANGLKVAETTNGRDARVIVDSLSIHERMVSRFPGLWDGEEDVNGGDLVDWITYELSGRNCHTLRAYVEQDYHEGLKRETANHG